MKKQFEVIKFEIAKLELKPEDILIIKCDTVLPFEQIDKIKETVREVIKENKILYLDRMELAVLKLA